MTNLPCLPLLKERFLNKIKNDIKDTTIKYPRVKMNMFLQTWSSTALGFNGWGGQAFTDAYTTVIEEINTGYFGVFFDERLAYIVKYPNEIFQNDLKNKDMKSVLEANCYIENTGNFYVS